MQIHKDQNSLRYEGLKHKGLYFNVFEKYQAAGSRARAARSFRRPPNAPGPAVDLPSADMYDNVHHESEGGESGMPEEPMGWQMGDDCGAGPSSARSSRPKRKPRQQADDRLADAVAGITTYFTNKSARTSTTDEATKATMLGEADRIMEEMGVATEDALTVYLWLRKEKEVLADFPRLSVEKRWGLIRRITAGLI